MSDVIEDPVRFARTVFDIDPYPYTHDALRSKAAVVDIAGGRRSAKTLTSQIKVGEVAFTRRGSQSLIVGPNESSVRRYLSETAALVEGTEFGRGAVVDSEAMVLRFANQSEVVGLPPTPGRLRGYGARVWLIVIDEAGYCPASVWSDARYCLLDHQAEGAQAWLIGSPWGGDEHFFKQMWQAGMDGDPDVDSFQWRTDQNPRLPPGWLARERERINAIEAAGELDGQWTGDGEQFYPRALLDRCVADIEPPSEQELGGRARGICSFDWGVQHDQSVRWMDFRTPISGLNPDREFRPTFVGWPRLYPAATPLVDVVDDAVECQSPFKYWASETNGCGSMPSQELARRIKARPTRPGEHRHWLLTATTSAKKLAAHATLRWMMERGQIILARDVATLRQFASMRYDATGRSGSIQGGDAATHDDIVDAAALATLPVLIDGRVVCHMQELAGERAVPDAHVGALDVPVVQTGGGVNVYAKPVLQSVDDMQITLPAGARPAVPRDSRMDAVREQVRTILHSSETE